MKLLTFQVFLVFAEESGDDCIFPDFGEFYSFVDEIISSVDIWGSDGKGEITLEVNSNRVVIVEELAAHILQLTKNYLGIIIYKQ